MTTKKNPTSDAFAQVSRKPTADDLQQARLKSQLAGGIRIDSINGSQLGSRANCPGNAEKP